MGGIFPFGTGTRTPEQAPSGSRLRSGDAAQTQSQQGRGLSKSSEINGAWQIGATGSDEKVRQQDCGLTEVILNNGAPDESQRIESRKRKAFEDSEDRRRQKKMKRRQKKTEEHENKLKRIFSWIGHNPSEPSCESDSFDMEACVMCGKVVDDYDNPMLQMCRMCEAIFFPFIFLSLKESFTNPIPK